MAAEYRLSCQTKNTCYSWLNTPSRERGAGEAAPVGLKNTPVSCPSQDLSRQVNVAPGICARTIRCQNEKLTGKESLRSDETRKDTRRPGDRRRARCHPPQHPSAPNRPPPRGGAGRERVQAQDDPESRKPKQKQQKEEGVP